MVLYNTWHLTLTHHFASVHLPLSVQFPTSELTPMDHIIGHFTKLS